MKKFIFVFILCFIVGFGVVVTYAAENPEETKPSTSEVVEPTTTEPPVEEIEEKVEESQEEVAFQDQLNDFLNKWFGLILGIIGGAGSAGLVVLSLIKMIANKLKNHEEITQDDVDKLKEATSNAKDELYKAKDELKNLGENFASYAEQCSKDFETLKETYIEREKKLGKVIDDQTAKLDLVIELVCKMVATNTSLASNGYAQQIIELCSKKMEGVEVNE